jgi:sulfonate transport system ATP-binding protein
MTPMTMESALFDALYERRRPSETDPAPLPVRPSVRPGAAVGIVNLSKGFAGRAVLRDLSLEIAPGEFVAIVGRSGCGKSTLLRLLAGLDVADAGHIQVDRRPVTGVLGEARLMFQDPRLLPWRRVIANVGIGQRGNWYYQALSALRSVGLDGREHDWPAILSGGQRQRVALARALISRPKLMLLDEPFAALDALTRLEMQQLIEAMWLRQRFTTLLVTHDVREAIGLADRVILIENGGIALELDVPNERPRTRSNAKLALLETKLLDRLLQYAGGDGKVSRFTSSRVQHADHD